MPSCTSKNGRRKWRASVMVQGISRKRWFPDDSEESRLAAEAWEREERERIVAEIRLSQEGNGAPIRIISCDLWDWAVAYLKYMESKAPKTFDEARSSFKRFLAAFRLNPDAPSEADPEYPLVEELTKRQILDYFLVQAEHRSGYAANKDRKNLAAAWDWGIDYLEQQGFPQEMGNLVRRVKRFQEVREPRVVPTDDHVIKLLEHARERSSDSLVRLQDWVMLVGYKGLLARKAELFRLKPSEVNFDNRTVGLWTRKRAGGNFELDHVPMTTEVLEAFRIWDEARPEGLETFFACLEDTPFTRAYLGVPFAKRNHWMPRLCVEAGVPEFGLHGFRHWGAVRMLKSGCSIAEIQRALRHMSPRTTEIYLTTLGKYLEETRQAMEKALATQASPNVIVKKAGERGKPSARGKIVPFMRVANT